MAEPVKKTIQATSRNFNAPGEVRHIDKGQVEVVNLGEVQAMRATFEPGWRWSESVKPIAGTHSCEVAHLGYVLSGTMVVRMDSGQELELNAGDVCAIPPGHDAWITGDQPCVILDFQGATNYAKPQP